VAHRVDGEPGDEGRLGGVRRRHDEAGGAAPPHALGDGQRPCHGADAAVEAKLADRRKAAAVGPHLSGGLEQRQGDGEVE